MPESGIPSAAGLCLESTFRSVPHTSTQIGVTGSNPHRFFTLEAGGGFPVRPDMVVPNDEIDGDLELGRVIQVGNGAYQGNFAIKMDGENCIYPLLGFFGRMLWSKYVKLRTDGIVSGGTFTITVGADTTAALAFDITKADLVTALESLTSVGVDKVVIAGTDGGSWLITFDSTLGSLVVSIDTALITGGGDILMDEAFKLRFTVNSRGFKPSFSVEEIFGASKNYGRLTTGAIVERFQTDFSDILMGRIGLYGHRQIPNSYRDATRQKIEYDFGSSEVAIPIQMGGDGSATIKRTTSPGYVDVVAAGSGNGPFIFGDMIFGEQAGFESAFMMINDVAKPTIEIMSGFNIAHVHAVQSQRVGGSGLDPGAVVGNQFETTGTMNLLFRDNMIPLATLQKKKVSFNFKFEGINIGDTEIPYSIEYHVPSAHFLEGGVEMPASQMLSGGNWVAKKDATLGYAIAIDVVTSFDPSELAGDASTTGAAGGLGGWNNV